METSKSSIWMSLVEHLPERTLRQLRLGNARATTSTAMIAWDSERLSRERRLEPFALAAHAQPKVPLHADPPEQTGKGVEARCSRWRDGKKQGWGHYAREIQDLEVLTESRSCLSALSRRHRTAWPRTGKNPNAGGSGPS